ncbi:RagB/SusD family nutrient uptake outer membrane protein [Sphingobacterium lumbrici]|uniref:RagB/SusD family nutrient uptake outer membrane protein n=1 Tax=Sphingobacterium lumbrici TaxID=2559600 RepID=UPI00112AC61E|nr:RagB/SusD family nutrient uptake outer membrane protein [Sphingobacterium lumbrici]
MKNNLSFMIIIAVVAMFSSCKKFLDLKPEDQLLEEQVFSSKQNIDAAMNGLYVRISANNLYGETLTLTVPEVMAQRFNVNPQHDMARYATHAYTDGVVANRMANIWSSAYSVVLGVNVFMDRLNQSPGLLSTKADSLYRGEALAMRAMLHFDMLRLFGPMYLSADSTAKSIPYCKQSDVSVQPFLAANEVMSHIAGDLRAAELLLENDKAMEAGRKYKFNYYAVKALQARVNLYRGNKPEALEAAKVIIDNDSKFPWSSPSNILVERINPDLIFSSEIILGVYNSELYERFQKLFSGDLADRNILAPLEARLISTFESNTSDLRGHGPNQLWRRPGTKSYMTFFKHVDIDDKGRAYRNTIALLRKSEMYYIAAECEPDKVKGIEYLSTVRLNRNIAALAPTLTDAQFKTEIQKEYVKEFFGEGQLFFYFKRNNVTSIPAGTVAIGNTSMTPVKYIVPIPQAEISNRNESDK